MKLVPLEIFKFEFLRIFISLYFLEMVFNNDAKRIFGTTNLYEILQLHGSKKVRQNYTREESMFQIEIFSVHPF